MRSSPSKSPSDRGLATHRQPASLPSSQIALARTVTCASRCCTERSAGAAFASALAAGLVLQSEGTFDKARIGKGGVVQVHEFGGSWHPFSEVGQ
jgi:hypothetical protein